MSKPAQNYKNHTKFEPAFHFVTIPILLVNLFWAVKVAIQAPAASTIIASATAVALLLLALLARMFALKAQDRVIRLEMRLLLKELLPPALQPRIMDFTTGQLVAMRFASDAELPDLAQAVLRDGLRDKNQIKRLIKNWKADHQRV